MKKVSKKLRAWREEYAREGENVKVLEEIDIFSMLESLAEERTFKRIRIEHREEVFRRNLERKELHNQIQIMKREVAAYEKMSKKNNVAG